MTVNGKIKNNSKIFSGLIALFFMAIPLDYVLPHFGNATVLFVLGIVISLFSVVMVFYKKQLIITNDQAIILFLMILCMISVIWATDIVKSRSYAFSFIATAAMYFFLMFFSFSKDEIQLFERASIIGGILLVLYVLTQADLGLVNAGYRLDFSNIGSEEFSDPNGLAARLVMPTVLMIKNIFEGRRLLAKLICLTGLVGILYVIFLTASRAAIITLAAVAFIILINNIKGKYMGTVLIVLFLGVIALSYLPEILPEHIYNRIFSFEKYQEVTTLEGDRLDIWKNVILDVFPRSPIFGHGAGNSSIALSNIYGRIKAVHNSWLVLLADLGLMGFIPWLTLIIGKVKQAFNIRKENIYVFAIIVGIVIMATTLDSEKEKYLWNGFFYIHLILTMYDPMVERYSD